MAKITKSGMKRTRANASNPKKTVSAPPLSGRYSRSEGPGKGPERHHNGPKR